MITLSLSRTTLRRCEANVLAPKLVSGAAAVILYFTNMIRHAKSPLQFFIHISTNRKKNKTINSYN